MSPRRKSVVVVVALVGASAVVFLVLLATGIAYLGPTLTVVNDQSRIVTLTCDREYQIAPGARVSVRLDSETDGLDCTATGTPEATKAGELCIVDVDFRGVETIVLTKLYDYGCP